MLSGRFVSRLGPRRRRGLRYTSRGQSGALLVFARSGFAERFGLCDGERAAGLDHAAFSEDTVALHGRQHDLDRASATLAVVAPSVAIMPCLAKLAWIRSWNAGSLGVTALAWEASF